MQTLRYRHILAVSAIALGLLGCDERSPELASDSSFSLRMVAEGKGESVDMARPLVVRAGPNGLLYIGSQRSSGLPMVLDSTAGFVRTLGRRGEGPGEITDVANLYPRGDSIVVGDQRRATLLFDPQGNFVRMLPRTVAWIGQVFTLRGDTVLVAEPISTESRFGLPLHLMAPTGDTISFGSDDRSFDMRRMMAMVRVVTPETDSTFWVGRADRYELQRWHMNGRLLSTLGPSRDWFPPQTKDWDGSNSSPMPTRIKNLHWDGKGHLFVMMERARADRPDQPDNGGREPTRASSLTERLTFMEQVIEVIDVSTGELLGAMQVPGTYLMNFVDDGRLVGLKDGRNGEELPVVYRVVYPKTMHMEN